MAKKTQGSKEIKSPASKFGQMIGEVFAEVVDNLIAGHIEAKHPEYELRKGEAGALTVKLSKVSGTELQIDTLIVAKAEQEPVALLESKWLKDARHHNDKGGWILQLPLIKKLDIVNTPIKLSLIQLAHLLTIQKISAEHFSLCCLWEYFTLLIRSSIKSLKGEFFYLNLI